MYVAAAGVLGFAVSGEALRISATLITSSLPITLDKGELNITGNNATGIAGTAAADVVIITGGIGGVHATGGVGGKGSGVKYTAGAGGQALGGGSVGGAGGDIEVTAGTGGTGGAANGADGEIRLNNDVLSAKDIAFVQTDKNERIGSDTSTTLDLYATDNIHMHANTVIDSGVLFLSETTTPTAITNHGAIYTKNTNDLFFQDGAGNEHLLHGDSFSTIWFHGTSTVEVTISAIDTFTLIDSFAVVGNEDDLSNADSVSAEIASVYESSVVSAVVT